MSTIVNAFVISFAAAATVTAGFLTWRWRKTYNKYNSLRSLPSPPGYWLLGNLPQILAAVKKKKFFQLIFNWAKELGPIYVYWVGRTPIVVLSDPKVIESTIINGMRDGSLVRTELVRQAWNDISGPILLGQNGTEWQWRRKALNPEFAPNALSTNFTFIERACLQVVETIEQTAPSEIIEVDRLFVELTMRVIFCLLLGIPIDKRGVSAEGPPLEIERIYEAMAVLSYRFLRVATGEKRWQKYLPIKSSFRYWQARKYLAKFLTPRIDLAIQMRDNPDMDWEKIGPLFKQSMLVKIALKEPKYQQDSLIAELIELSIAGTDTTAHSLSCAVAELSLNQKVFQKARDIVDKIWETSGGISIENINELSYISAIFKETLRLYSIASGSTSLQAQRDTNVAGLAILQGTKIYWSTLAAGRDANVYPSPEEFLPERWLGNDRGLPIVTFGSGLHRCLGEHLAILEATIMLAILLRKFDWELVNGRSSLENLEQDLLIYPADGMPVKFTAREFAKQTANVK